MRFDLILTMRDILINSNLHPPTKFNSSSSFEFIGKSIETATITSEFPNGKGKAIAEQILVLEERNTSKRTKSRTERVTVRDPNRKVNHLSKVIRKIITVDHRSISSTRIG